MKLAFTLFHYFPYGGLERDALALAELCHARGHEVVLLTRQWDGPRPKAIAVVELPVRALSNHRRGQYFAKRCNTYLQANPVDLVVGFNKMPGLDVYYAADVCFAQKAYGERNFWYRLSARARAYLSLEKSVFAPAADTALLMIAKDQIPLFQHYYQTPSERFYLLPPGIRKDRCVTDDYETRRTRKRHELGLSENQSMLIMVGSDFHRKGVGRAINALALLKNNADVHLYVAGDDDASAFIKQAGSLGIAQQVHLLGPRDDVADLLFAADVFLHPAYSENTGTVILEAMVAGLPAIVSDVCGYAHYVTDFDFGAVIPSANFEQSLARAITEQLNRSRAACLTTARLLAKENIFSMTECAADIIESIKLRR